MNQEKIAQFIKSIRTKQHLSQQKFAEKYGVTYQAVSKWENGKNMPDLSILKQMCKDNHMNLDDFLDAKEKHTNKKKIVFGLILLILFIVLIIGLFFLLQNRESKGFEFKTLSTTCDDFKLYGSLAYDNKKSSIYISNITYCGGDDNNTYQTIHCILYETNGKNKIEISRYDYENKAPITLEEFLKNVNFKVDHYEKTCKIYKENSLHLEIDAIDSSSKITSYKIPLTLEDTCTNELST